MTLSEVTTISTGRHAEGYVAGAASPLRSSRWKDVAVRIALAMWFLALAVTFCAGLSAAVMALPNSATRLADWSSVISRSTSLLFFCMLCCVSLLRPTPVARRTGVMPNLIAFVGTYGVWLSPLLPVAHASPAIAIAGSATIIVGSLFIIVSITRLGQSFSIVPQARTLVVSGPYRLVRHPLYLAEEIALAGLLLQYAWPFSLAFLAIHFAFQIQRMLYEEELLSATFPDYASYARKTARLIPGIW